MAFYFLLEWLSAWVNVTFIWFTVSIPDALLCCPLSVKQTEERKEKRTTINDSKSWQRELSVHCFSSIFIWLRCCKKKPTLVGKSLTYWYVLYMQTHTDIHMRAHVHPVSMHTELSGHISGLQHDVQNIQRILQPILMNQCDWTIRRLQSGQVYQARPPCDFTQTSTSLVSLQTRGFLPTETILRDQKITFIYIHLLSQK